MCQVCSVLRSVLHSAAQVNTDPMTWQAAWLSVLEPPDIDNAHSSGDLVAREHEDTARLVCTANGNLTGGKQWSTAYLVCYTGVPRPRIVWRREGGRKIRIRAAARQHRLVSSWSGDSLEIHRVRREDMGAYLCIASNDVPPAVSKRIYLHVQCTYHSISHLFSLHRSCCSRTERAARPLRAGQHCRLPPHARVHHRVLSKVFCRMELRR